MANFFLGIDTGGTHTDIVLYEPKSKVVTATAKAETTHHDLSLGISNALKALKQGCGVDFKTIGRINLSTTLATNSIAEGLISRTGLILIGYDENHKPVRRLTDELPQVMVACVAGGHDFYGNEETPLDKNALSQIVEKFNPQVSGWAVSGFFSVKNPAHEIEAALIIRSLSSKPITLGRDLTGQLDAPRRAATAALNAGLVPTINRLLDAVKKSVADLGLDGASLMVVKGDGSLVQEKWARDKPIETVVSGPAAGLVGANILANGFLSPTEKNLWVLDVGGTTTDMAFVKNGRPAVNPNGALVGKWNTMTVAVETRTKGLGGDSLATIDSAGLVALGPRRVLPLCRLAQNYPLVVESLRSQLALGAPGTVAGHFFLRGTPPDGALNHDESAIIEALKEQNPLAMADYAQASFDSGHNFMGLMGLSHPAVLVSAFTPTDAMAILGLYNGGVRQASIYGAQLLGRALKLSPENLARLVLDEFGRLLAQEVVSYGFHREGITVDTHDFSALGVFSEPLGRRGEAAIRVSLKA
ncbi:MAG: hydantoinase/oxoprolinase N-terminal domain-containing protein, partial [Candidatus Adiutrix sp.]